MEVAKRFDAGDVANSAEAHPVRHPDELTVERPSQLIVNFLLRYQQLDARPTDHRLGRLADVVQFDESDAKGVSFVEEAQRVVADEGAQAVEQFALAFSHGGDGVDRRMSDVVFGGGQRRLERVGERQLLAHGVDARPAVVEQGVECAPVSFQTVGQ